MQLVGKYGNQRVLCDMQHTFAAFGSDVGLTNDQMANLMGHRKTKIFELVYKHDIRQMGGHGRASGILPSRRSEGTSRQASGLSRDRTVDLPGVNRML